MALVIKEPTYASFVSLGQGQRVSLIRGLTSFFHYKGTLGEDLGDGYLRTHKGHGARD